MALDPGIFGQVGNYKTMADYDKEAQSAQINKLALLQAQGQYDQQQRGLSDDNALRAIYQQAGNDPTAIRQGLMQGGQYKAVQAFDKQQFDNQKTQSEIGLSNAHAKNFDAEAAGHVQTQHFQNVDRHLQDLQSINTPEDFAQWATDGVKNGTMSLQGAAQNLTAIQQNPQSLATVKQNLLAAGQSVVEKAKLDQAKAIADQSNATSISNNALTNKTHLQGVSMTQGAENNRAALTRAQQLLMSGMTADGGISPNLEAEAQLIAKGNAAPPSGMAATRPQTAALMARVQQINPAYDATDYGAKVKAAKDFTSGSQGNQLRSFAVAGQHLDQLNTLVDALNNRDTQLLNRVGNAYASQTGNPAPTNFEAAKDVVSKEVIKAIIAGGGGQGEREALAKTMSNANSPTQLKGVIQQYRNLMGAQHDALLDQRRAAGLPDSTLPGYSQPAGAAAVPADIAAILAKHGAKQP